MGLSQKGSDVKDSKAKRSLAECDDIRHRTCFKWTILLIRLKNKVSVGCSKWVQQSRRDRLRLTQSRSKLICVHVNERNINSFQERQQ